MLTSKKRRPAESMATVTRAPGDGRTLAGTRTATRALPAETQISRSSPGVGEEKLLPLVESAEQDGMLVRQFVSRSLGQRPARLCS